MAICIIGAGLSGLALSIYIKLTKSDVKITLINSKKSGNTMMAGQRFRPLIKKEKNYAENLFIELLQKRNNGEITEEMKYFAKTAKEELEFWTHLKPKDLGFDISPLNWKQEENWFGPQLGEANQAGFGRGKNLISWLTNLAINLGVEIIEGNVTKLNREDDKINSIQLEANQEVYLLSYQYYVLAGGSIGGSLFNSTNVPITNSPQELAFDMGAELVGGTVNMFHILGNTNINGDIKVGCFETDNLEAANIYLYDKKHNSFSIYDDETTKLLSQHQAHYHFYDISKRFLEHGGIVQIRSPNHEINYGRVSHHYSHMGIKTTDGVKVCGISNLFAIGDASNTGHWTGYKVRYPGMALSNCLVTAKLVADSLSVIKFDSKKTQINKLSSSCEKIKNLSILKKINTDSLLSLEFQLDDEAETISKWHKKLANIKEKNQNSILLDISFQLAKAFKTTTNTGSFEPTPIIRESLFN